MSLFDRTHITTYSPFRETFCLSFTILASYLSKDSIFSCPMCIWRPIGVTPLEFQQAFGTKEFLGYHVGLFEWWCV